MTDEEKASKYIAHFPSIYQGGDEPLAFFGRFLKAFEKVISGIDDDVKVDGETIEGIEKKLEKIHTYFDPDTTPPEFLKWLAGWVALTLKEGEGWDEQKKRRLITQIVPLYKIRGTRKGLEEYMKIYVGEDVKISIREFLQPFQINVTSTIGVDTVVGEGRPYYFQVYMELPAPDRVMLEKKRRAIRDIINREKPAHTYYDLIIKVPTMQINVHSTIGVDTLLGGLIGEFNEEV